MSEQFGTGTQPGPEDTQNNPEQQQGQPYQQGQQDTQYHQQNQQYQQYQQAPPYYQQYPGYPQYEAPMEIRRWNWGAFMFNIIWGIGNKTWIALLCLIPCFGFVFAFILGAKGNEWAWKANHYKDVDTFRAVQETWNRAGFVYFWIYVALIVFYIIFLVAVGASISSLSGFMDGYSNSYY